MTNRVCLISQAPHKTQTSVTGVTCVTCSLAASSREDFINKGISWNNSYIVGKGGRDVDRPQVLMEKLGAFQEG